MVLVATALAAGVGVLLVWRASTVEPSVDLSHGRLIVSDDKRFIQHADGTPFFYLGDTAWELFHRLNREEADLYLEDRRAKGFTVIQAVALAELGGTTVPNAYGHLPLIDRDPTRPDLRTGTDNDYWDHVDYVVDKAGEKGMYVGFLPTWGDKVEKLWGNDGNPIFTTGNARSYGVFLGRRYRDKPNIVWILGGDRGPNSFDIESWREMARGLRQGDRGSHLVTYHPRGGRSSSALLHSDPLFDFNLVQSGHCGSYEGALRLIVSDYGRSPTKPTIDGEPRYEDHPKCQDTSQGWWDARDARYLAYLQAFSGAFGHTYGDHNIWQFWQSGREPASSARTPWRTAIDHEGAGQMQHVRRLLESRPSLSRVPDQSAIVSDEGSGEGMIRATRDAHGAYAMVYTGKGDTFTVDLAKLAGASLEAWWYNPRTGRSSAPWQFANTKATMSFDPAGSPSRTNDWVLVLDDASRDFGTPGTSRAD